MKRYWIGSAVAAMSVGLVCISIGCAKQQTVKGEETVTQPQAAAPQAAPAPQAAVAEDVEKLLQTIHFDFNMFNIRSGDAKILRENAEVLKSHGDVKIRIEGNCDERGSEQYNLALGERRANAAAKYLETLGIAKGRITTVSYGKERPVDPGHDEEAWAKNRRDDFRVLP